MVQTNGQNDSPKTEIQIPGLRRSVRDKRVPVWAADYVVTTETGYVQDKPTEYFAFMSQVQSAKEPHLYSLAKGHPEWEDAMSKELQALESIGTWVLTELPTGHKAIGSKWVYKIKFKADGSIDRYKARLVVKGFNQKNRQRLQTYF